MTSSDRPADSDQGVQPYGPPTQAQRVRQVVNAVNLSTALGLVAARIGGAQLSHGPRGTLLATDYRFRFPVASAFTVGDVIISKKSLEQLTSRPVLLSHECRHSTQYACCLGALMLPAYGVAAIWSLLRTGDPASRNVFERRAGLVDGGYVERPLRRRRRRRQP